MYGMPFFISRLQRAGRSTSTACFADAEWKFDDPTQKAYELVLNLQLEEVHQLIPAPETAHQHYVVASSRSVGIAHHRRRRKVHRIRRSIY